RYAVVNHREVAVRTGERDVVKKLAQPHRSRYRRLHGSHHPIDGDPAQGEVETRGGDLGRPRVLQEPANDDEPHTRADWTGKGDISADAHQPECDDLAADSGNLGGSPFAPGFLPR